MNRQQPALRFIEAAPVIAALGDRTRMHLVNRLCSRGPLPTARLTEGAKISRQAITKHLRALEGAGLVRSRRAGRECLWELETKRLAIARRFLDRISLQWDQAVDRLRQFVETGEK
jgi:DNA-binding transcriptional ArsR family regulator